LAGFAVERCGAGRCTTTVRIGDAVGAEKLASTTN
jgi:hypothetical protein